MAEDRVPAAAEQGTGTAPASRTGDGTSRTKASFRNQENLSVVRRGIVLVGGVQCLWISVLYNGLEGFYLLGVVEGRNVMLASRMCRAAGSNMFPFLDLLLKTRASWLGCKMVDL
jgi:hypothetical protein